MNKVTKKNGVFTLEPDPLITARQQSKDDQEKLKSILLDEELRRLLERILLRIDNLERNT